MSERFYWQGRMVSKGPLIGVATWFGPPLVEGEELDRSPRWQALVRTETTARAILLGDSVPIEVEGIFLRNVERTTKSNYDYLISHAAFSTSHAPHNPDASPTEAIDFNKLTPF